MTESRDLPGLPSDPLGKARPRTERAFRLRGPLRALSFLGDAINDTLEAHDPLPLREGEEDVSLYCGAVLGRGNKNNQAVTRLSILGYGEDALILVRANVNLLVDAAYILGSDPDERLERFKNWLAFSYKARVYYLRVAHNTEPPWPPPVPVDEVERRSQAWPRIEQRARGLTDFHYASGYRLYSSLEHSDAWGLSEFLIETPMGHVAGTDESDKFCDLALVHGYLVLAELFLLFCRYFAIGTPEILTKIRQVGSELPVERSA